MPTLFGQVKDSIAEAGTLGIVGGGILGALTGHLRHQFENKVEDKDDPDTETLKKKVFGYQKMTRELETARAAELPQ